jgi:hypothetical protein
MDFSNSTLDAGSSFSSTTGSELPGQLCPDNIIQELDGTKPWVRFISIVGFIFGGLMCLAALFIMVSGSMFSGSSYGQLGSVGMAIIGVVYLMCGGLYILLSSFLTGYANAIDRVMKSKSANDAAQALSSQKMFWKVTGILTIIGLCIVVLSFFAAIAIPLMISH